MDYKEFYKQVYGRDFQADGAPHGWIQWKGTRVCMDIHCACGELQHFDGEFFYYYECPNCKRRYAVGQNVKLIELTAEEVVEVEEDSFKS